MPDEPTDAPAPSSPPQPEAQAQLGQATNGWSVRPVVWLLAVVAALLLAAVTPWFTVWLNSGMGKAPRLSLFGNGYLPIVPLLLVVLLAMVWNPIMRRCIAFLALRPAELIVMTGALYVVAGVAGSGGSDSLAGRLQVRDGMAGNQTLEEWYAAYPESWALPALKPTEQAISAATRLNRALAEGAGLAPMTPADLTLAAESSGADASAALQLRAAVGLLADLDSSVRAVDSVVSTYRNGTAADVDTAKAAVAEAAVAALLQPVTDLAAAEVVASQVRLAADLQRLAGKISDDGEVGARVSARLDWLSSAGALLARLESARLNTDRRLSETQVAALQAFLVTGAGDAQALQADLDAWTLPLRRDVELLRGLRQGGNELGDLFGGSMPAEPLQALAALASAAADALAEQGALDATALFAAVDAIDLPANLTIPADLRSQLTSYAADPAAADEDTVALLQGELAQLARSYQRAAERSETLGGQSLFGDVLAPLLSSSWLVLASLILVIGIVAITGRQWSHHERLQHPLVQVPNAVVEGSVLKDKGFRIALLIMGLYWVYQLTASYGVNPLPLLATNPLVSVPDLYKAVGIETSSGWVYSGFWGRVNLFPFVVAIAFLLAADVGFSVWGGFWFGCLICGWLYAAGLQVDFYKHVRVAGGGGGALLAMAVVIAWLGRHHYWALFKAAVGVGAVPEDRTGVWGARFVMIGLIGLIGVITFISGNVVAGVISALLVAAFIVVVARVVAEAGLACFQSPSTFMEIAVGMGLPYLFPARAMMMLTWIGQTMLADTRQHLSGYMVQGTVLGEQRGAKGPGLTFALGGIAILALIVATMSGLLSAWVQNGLGTPNANDVMSMSRRMTTEYSPAFLGMDIQVLSIVGGFLMVFAVMGLRRVWNGCPLHPLGLVVATSWPVHLVWGSLAIGWLCKLAVLRYGGSGLYSRLKPVAYGVILGDVLGYGLQIVIQVVVRLSGSDLGGYGGWT